ncbi:MAG: hypothetical protein A2848_02860 [Candidatus Magasanikbacteria bacterium RIFCSPHIGHO2_01_FULL_50_8]|uniref:Septum formation initiator n=2 Tax=Candidatus Magasanikiibacteriota TaxID=1752731 RepID=A0A1F6LNV1_9BACT|nr:MAG: hypothetical protein A2848_02860 [Candidatus Magasanikbacteria bacterium RIFCSPHIGHO2_01_FULL_50_8]OGH67642.1 MAG: hypothetical protein A3C15_02370 [Candidatus Magasanikbacteria bacterium RIFCSPHIGHO2_02_FULL_50_9b]
MSDAPSRKKSRLVIVVVVLLFIFLLISFLRVFFKDYELRKEIERLQTDVGKLEKRKIESLDVLKKLQSDAYIEARAREELQAAKPGEAVIVVPGLSVSSTVPRTLEAQPIENTELSNPLKWWYYFFRPQK